MVKPRIALAPRRKRGKLVDQAVELCGDAGIELDDWQEHVLRASLSQTRGKWDSFEIGVNVARQNGKGVILEARELAGLFVYGERYIIHTAHLIDTSLEAFRRLLDRIEDTPPLAKQLKRVSQANGREAIELKNGCRIRFRTRTKGGGRGFSADCLILDEAMFLPTFAHGALLPTLSARPNPQVWYTGSSVDQLVHEHGVVFASVRERAQEQSKSLCYFEWSANVGDAVDDNPDSVPYEAIKDQAAWAQANPSLGLRIEPEHVEKEQRSLDPRTFAVERLGIGDWPPTDQNASVIDLETWLALEDSDSRCVDPVVFAFDVRPDRSSAAISVSGRRPDGQWHIEVVDRKRGTDWVIPRLLELGAKHRTTAIIYDQVGPAASLPVVDLEQRGFNMVATTARELANACGLFYDTVQEGGLRHMGTSELTAALRGAQRRPLGDAWAWSRKNSAVDISPLVGCTLALWGVASERESELFSMAW